MVRIDVLASGRASIIAKGGRYLAPDLHGNCVPLPQADLLMFRLGLEDMQFWSLPPKIQWMGFDGAFWTLEGLEAGRYHAVERWSPRGKLWKLGRMMLRMCGIDVSQIKC